MNILSIYWGFSVGGIAKYAANIDLIGKHSKVTITSLCIIPYGREVDWNTLNSIDATVINVRSIFDFTWINKIRKIISDKDIECIFSHGFNGHLVCLIATMNTTHPIRRLASYHGSYHPNTTKRRIVAPLYNWFTNWFLANKANAIACVAHWSMNDLIKNGVPANNITVIHNGISELKPIDNNQNLIRQEWGFDQTNIVIGTASRIEKIKGLDYLIKSFSLIISKHINIRLVIIGDGTQIDELRQLSDELNVNKYVKFAGARNDVPACLTAIDIFALPSLSEAHSIGLLEAMRAELPIIATDVGGNTETVRHEQEGLIAKPADVEGLTDALDRLLSNVELRKEIAKAAHQRFINEFTEEAMLNKTATWLNKACSD